MHDNPDFVKLAEAYGIPGFRCTQPEELRPLLEKAAAMDGPVLLDIHVDQEANVFPMIPAGKSVAEMIGKKGRSWDMKHTLSILVQNQAGVLSRVAALFTRRGYNIESIAVGPTEDPGVARMTIVVEGDPGKWSRSPNTCTS